MKNTIIITVLAFLLTAQAQAQLRFGVKAGYSASYMTGWEKLFSLPQDEYIIDDFSTSYRSGFHTGFVMQYDIPLTGFFLQTELLYSLQGMKGTLEARPIPSMTGYDMVLSEEDEAMELFYIQLPIYGGYKFGAGAGLDLLVGAGPYFAYGVSGEDDAFESLKRFDFGLGFLAGVQLSRFQITAGYDIGLIDLMNIQGWKTAKDLAGLSSISNRNFKASLVYFF